MKEEDLLDFNKAISKEDILRLAQHDVVVYAVVAAMNRGWIGTWEEALMRCIYLLHEQNTRLQKLNLELISNAAYPDSRLTFPRSAR